MPTWGNDGHGIASGASSKNNFFESLNGEYIMAVRSLHRGKASVFDEIQLEMLQALDRLVLCACFYVARKSGALTLDLQN